MSELKELIARLEGLTGPSREVDAAIYGVMPGDAGWIAFRVRDYSKLPGSRLDRYHDGWLAGRHEFDQYAEELPRFTTSLDAAVGLVKRVLPNKAAREVSFWPGIGARVCLLILNDEGAHRAAYGRYKGEHTLEPVALLIALLHAKEHGAQERSAKLPRPSS